MLAPESDAICMLVACRLGPRSERYIHPSPQKTIALPLSYPSPPPLGKPDAAVTASNIKHAPPPASPRTIYLNASIRRHLLCVTRFAVNAWNSKNPKSLYPPQFSIYMSVSACLSASLSLFVFFFIVLSKCSKATSIG